MHFRNVLLAAFAGFASVNAQTIIDILNNTPELSTLKSLITKYQDLLQLLSQASDITVVAPTNDAFQKFLHENPGADQNRDLVENLITYHVITGIYDSAAITGSPGPKFPPTLLSNPDYSLVSGGQRVKAAAEGSSVVFTSGLLKKSTVTKADVRFTGGVAHLVDGVLAFPRTTSETALVAGLNKLVEAINTAGLDDHFDSASDVTVFAPSEDAFNAIAGTIAGLTPDDLRTILTYHIVPDTVAYSQTLSDGLTLSTVQGASVTIKVSGGTITINDAKVVTADVLLKNGVAHVIEKVLQPSGQAGAGTGPGAGGTGGGMVGGGMNNQTNVTVPGTNFTASGAPTPINTPVVSTGAAVANWAGMGIDKAMAAGLAALALGAAI
ncbi:FAS1 domain-containing protein [Phyllosticta paracitricarpa]|uniref:FAS1 domain-containing protein n=1 Tax=Phyllosticta paracitricarpa TaxID=2016321 RepID=A0ABR1NFN7_9PEZI